MSDRLIIADARRVSAADFFSALTGGQVRSEAEKAEADARAARIRLATTIHDAEYAVARREREAIIRGGMQDGETYEEYHRRLNGPFYRAADRVNRRMAEIARRRAA